MVLFEQLKSVFSLFPEVLFVGNALGSNAYFQSTCKKLGKEKYFPAVGRLTGGSGMKTLLQINSILVYLEFKIILICVHF